MLSVIFRGAVWPCAAVVWTVGFFTRPVEKPKLNPPVERTASGRPVSNAWLVAALASSHLPNGRPDPLRAQYRPFSRLPDRLERLHPVSKTARTEISGRR
jgi:hypothetical protein